MKYFSSEGWLRGIMDRYRDAPGSYCSLVASLVIGTSLLITWAGGHEIIRILQHRGLFYEHFVIVSVILTIVASIQSFNLSRIKDILKKMIEIGKRESRPQEFAQISDVFRMLLTGFRLFSYAVLVILSRLGFTVIAQSWTRLPGDESPVTYPQSIAYFFAFMDATAVSMFFWGWTCLVLAELVSFDYKRPDD